MCASSEQHIFVFRAEMERAIELVWYNQHGVRDA